MKKYINIIMFSLFVMFSFYLTDKTALYVQSKDPIMQSITEYSMESDYEAVDAKITDDYIIPGMYGKRINEVKSLMNMKVNGVFNSLFLVTGNLKKKAISVVFENDETNALTYFVSSKIPASLLVNKDSYNQNPYFEQINHDFNNYKDVEKNINRDKINTNICIVGRSNKDICIKNKKYLVEPSLILNESNLISVKNNVSSGSIVMVKSSVSMDNIIILIKYVKSKGLDIVK